jgi:transposase
LSRCCRSCRVKPFARQTALLATIPGISERASQVIISESGVDMTRFPTAAHLASWAGLCPGNNESAGKHRSDKTRKGDTELCTVLTGWAWQPRAPAATSVRNSIASIAASAINAARRPPLAPPTPSS